MTAYAKPEDVPATWKPKRAIFYRHGLKIYGQIPYILQRLLGATFVSSEVSVLGGRIIGPSAEPNYTIVDYRRPNGQPHRQEAIETLLAWLLEDRGVEWALAAQEEFERTDLKLANWFNAPPHTWVPGTAPELKRLLAPFAGESNEND